MVRPAHTHPKGTTYSILYGVLCTSPKYCVAVGTYTTSPLRPVRVGNPGRGMERDHLDGTDHAQPDRRGPKLPAERVMSFGSGVHRSRLLLRRPQPRVCL